MDFDKVGSTAFPLQFNVKGPATDPITGRMVQAGAESGHVFTGMSLRDYFAAKALQGWLASYGSDDSHPANVGLETSVATLSYRLADAMLAERAK